MISSKVIPSLLLLAIASDSPCKASQIQWQPCDSTEFSSEAPLQCGSVLVPLDYTTPNGSEKLELQLIRTPATTQPSKGSILLNFGGPGEPGRENFAETVDILVPLNGGLYDLVAFDVRGTGTTLPVSCYLSDFEMAQMISDISQKSNASDTAAARAWARAGVDASLCLARAGQNATLVGTTFTARDLISIVDALGEDGMLRYWGFSYGTTLGFTVAAMFPDRIDKMILDGVQNPQEYYNSVADYEEWTDGDAAFSGIFSTCIDAGANCSLSQLNMTAAQLEEATWGLLDALKHEPIPIGASVLDYSYLKGQIQNALYGPASFPDLISLIEILLFSNATQLETLSDSLDASVTTVSSILPQIALTEAVAAIHCGDRKPRVATFDEFKPVLDKFYNISSVMGDVDDTITMRCARWRINAKETYEGGFNVKTKNPVLFIGNTWDPYTPLRSAKNVSAGFDGSAVLEVRGYGHSSLAPPSKCTLEKTQNYWLNRTLPEAGIVCEVDAPPYSNITWTDIFAEAGWKTNSTSIQTPQRKRGNKRWNL